MNCAEVQSALSELVEGTLARERRAQVEAHVASCADCRALLADIRQLREKARALPKVMPPEALWTKVRADFEAESKQAGARQGGSRQAGSLSYGAFGSLSQDRQAGSQDRQAGSHARQAGSHARQAGSLSYWTRRSVLAGLAAAAMVVLATSAGVYYATHRAATPAPTPAAAPVAVATSAHAAQPGSVQSIESELQLAVQHYENAIAGLDKVAREGQTVLDPQTAAVLAKSNAILDQAVSESQAALRTQPTNEVARASLFEALQRKVSLLRDTVALINEMRKGDTAGTARVVGGLGKS